MLIHGLRNTFKHLGGSKWLKEPRMAQWQGLQERAQTVQENGGPIVEGTCFPPGRGQQSRMDWTDLGRPEHLGGDWNVRLGRYVPRSSWEFRTPVSRGSFPYTSSKRPRFLLSCPIRFSHPWPLPAPLRVCWAPEDTGMPWWAWVTGSGREFLESSEQKSNPEPRSWHLQVLSKAEEMTRVEAKEGNGTIG